MVCGRKKAIDISLRRTGRLQLDSGRRAEIDQWEGEREGESGCWDKEVRTDWVQRPPADGRGEVSGWCGQATLGPGRCASAVTREKRVR